MPHNLPFKPPHRSMGTSYGVGKKNPVGKERPSDKCAVPKGVKEYNAEKK